MDVNQLFPWFSTRSDREGSLTAEWRANNFERRRLLNYFINMKDYIVKTTRSLRAEWNGRNILYSLRKGIQVVYLFHCMKTREPWTHCQGASINSKKQKISRWKGKKFPLNGGCFRKWILLLIILHIFCFEFLFSLIIKKLLNGLKFYFLILVLMIMMTSLFWFLS